MDASQSPDDGRPAGFLAPIAPLRADDGVTALAGRVARVDGVPLAGVTVSAAGATVVPRVVSKASALKVVEGLAPVGAAIAEPIAR
jgi:hypothetical protein